MILEFVHIFSLGLSVFLLEHSDMYSSMQEVKFLSSRIVLPTTAHENFKVAKICMLQ